SGGSGGSGGGEPGPGNRPPRAVAWAPATVRPGLRVLLEGGRSFDPEGAPLTYAWSQIGGVGVLLEGDDQAQAAFEAPAGRAALEFRLVVTDVEGLTDTATVAVQIGNTAPAVDAGPDQHGVAPEARIALDGSGSRDPDGDAITFLWRQVAGPEVLLDDVLSPRPAFTAPAGSAHLVFELAVDDGLATATDTVSIDVDNRPPVVEAGADRVVAPGADVRLDGSAEDPDGDPITLSWRQLEGLPVELDDASRADAGFRAPARRTALVFELTAGDGIGVSAPDRVTLLVDDVPPTADAGPDQLDVAPGTLVTLAGRGEDLDGDALTFWWSQTAGPAVALSDPRAAQPTFTAPDHRAALAFVLFTDDGVARSRPDEVTVTVRNTPPVADAGPDQSAAQATVVQLDGQDSRDADGDELRWTWSQTDGTPVVLAGADGPTPTFVAPRRRGPLTFRLSVADDAGPGAPDEVVVQVLNGAPTADAGPDAEVDGMARVTLDGSRSSDPDDDPLGFFWQQVEGTPVQLDGRNTARPTFRAPEARQRLRFELVVNDGAAESPPDAVVVDIRNHAPVANAGQNVTVDRDRQVTLNGSGTDADGDPLTYRWRQLRGREIQISDVTDRRATFRSPDADTEIELELIVNDGLVDSAPDTVMIRVTNGD
ncbi:PKD domain-containing protein, partial [Myxococcota bacterium]|nr:PKD domain-containing protein [Myxococcota bacterium]